MSLEKLKNKYQEASTVDSIEYIMIDEFQDIDALQYELMAVLYRAHYVSRSIEDALMKAMFPYTIYSGVQFLGYSEIKDAISYLRLEAYRDDLSFLRVCNVPKRNLGQRRNVPWSTICLMWCY